MKKIMVLVLFVLMIISAAGCSNNKKDLKKTTQAPVNTDKVNIEVNENPVIMTINGYEIKRNLYNIMVYEEAERFRGGSEPEEDLDEEQFEEWWMNFFITPIDGKMPIDIVKENVTEVIRKYVYQIQSAESAGIKLDDEQKTDIEINVIENMEEEYDPENPDEYFIYKYNATKQQYIDYKVSLALIEEYIDYEAGKINISSEEIYDYKEEYRAYYIVKTVRSIFLAADTADKITAKKPQAESLLQQIKNGADMKELVEQYSEAGGTDGGIFLVSKDERDYSTDIVDWVEKSNKGDSDIVIAQDGIYVLRIEDEQYEDNIDEEIKIILGREKYNENVAGYYNVDRYKPVLNENVYNSYTKFPGDLVADENAVG